MVTWVIHLFTQSKLLVTATKSQERIEIEVLKVDGSPSKKIEKYFPANTAK
jgi:hypothetical protein